MKANEEKEIQGEEGEMPSSARGMITKNGHPNDIASTNGTPKERSNNTEKTSDFIADKEKVNMCVTLFLLLPISFSGPCVSFLAYSFHLCGVFLGLILFTITTIICIYSSYLILRASSFVGVNTYHDLAGATTGKCVKVFIVVIQVFCLMGPSISACIYNKNLTVDFLESFDNIPSILLSKYFWATIYVWVGVFPWLSFPRLKGLQYVSYVTSGTCIVFAFINVAGVGNFGIPNPEKIKYFDFEFQPLLISFTFFLYPIVYQPNIQTVFNEMKNPTIKRSITILTINTIIIMITYCTIGIFGYLALIGEHSENLLEVQNVFLTFLGEWMPFTVVSLIFIGTTLATALALVLPPKMILLECMKRKGSSNVGWNTLAAFLICSVVYAFTMAIDKTTVVMRFNGVTAYPFLCFVLPSLFYIRATHRDKSRCNRVHQILSLVQLAVLGAYAMLGLIGIVNE